MIDVGLLYLSKYKFNEFKINIKKIKDNISM